MAEWQPSLFLGSLRQGIGDGFVVTETGRWHSPEEQIEYLQFLIRPIQELPGHPAQVKALRDTEADLAAMVAKHNRGELESVWYDPEATFSGVISSNSFISYSGNR